MSLINDMLRDLESRGSSGAAGQGLPERIMPADEIPSAAPAWVPYLLGLLLVAVVLGALGWVYREQIGRGAPTMGGLSANQPLAVNPMKPEAVPSTPVVEEVRASAPEVPVFPPPAANPRAASASPEPLAPSPTPEPPTAAQASPAPVAVRPSPPARSVASVAKPGPRPPRPALPEKPTSLRRGTTVTEDSAASLSIRGQQYVEAGQFSQARDVLERALRLDPDAAGARLLLARMYSGQGDVQGALELLSQRPPPGEAGDWSRLKAQLYLKQGRLAEAESAMDGLDAGESGDPELAGLWGALRQRQGRHGEAVEYYRKALALQPRQTRWWLGLAISLEASERFEEALRAYESVAELGGASPEVRSYVAGRVAVLRTGR